MDVAFTIQSLVATTVGFIISIFLLMRLLWTFVCSPVKFVKKTFMTRNEMPPCLNDPSLGSHGFVHLEEVKLHYVSCGDEKKPLMLCLHGFPEFWYSWRYIIPAFSKDFRVVAVDMRGYGDSDKPSGWKNYTIDKLINDIKQLIPALGHKSCTLLSHDWGGAVAWSFTANHQDLVDRVVVFNCPHPGAFQKYVRGNTTQIKKSWYMYFFQIRWIPELFMMAGNMKFVDRLLGSLPNYTCTEEDKAAYKYAFSSPGGISGPLNYYRAAFSRRQLTSKGPKIEKPMMIVWGDPDVALNTELAHLSAEYAENVTVKIIHNSDHFVLIDKPDECIKLVKEFISKS